MASQPAPKQVQQVPPFAETHQAFITHLVGIIAASRGRIHDTLDAIGTSDSIRAAVQEKSNRMHRWEVLPDDSSDERRDAA